MALPYVPTKKFENPYGFDSANISSPQNNNSGFSNFFGLNDNAPVNRWDALDNAMQQKLIDAGVTAETYLGADDMELSALNKQFGVDTSLFGMSPSSIQTGLGLGQLGLGLAGYLDNKKTAKLQRENLGTQIASNKDLLETRKKRAANIAATFG